METLQKFAQKNNLKVVEITYSSNGVKLKRKGYDLVKKDNRIFASFEPKYGYYKWYLRNGKTTSGKNHFVRITNKVLNTLSEENFTNILNI